MKVYLSNRMTDVPQFNIPWFDRVARELRALGHDVVSPAELDDPETRAMSLASADGALTSGTLNGETWGDFLARDVKLIADSDIEAIVVGPEWFMSRGARLEVTVAGLCDKPVYAYNEKDPADLRPLSIIEVNLGKLGMKPEESTSGEVRTINEKTGGQKGRKPQRLELLPWAELMQVSELYHAGAEKYDAHNWRRGFDWSLSFGAMMRHAALFWEGEDYDSETKQHHLTSVVFHGLALLYFAKHFPELDDRPPAAVVREAEDVLAAVA